MRIKELLVEYKIHTIDDNRARTSVKVIENPNKIQFMNLLYDKRNHDNVVRGLVVNDDIYIWIAYDATHFTVKQFLTRQGVGGESILFMFEVDENDPGVNVKLWIYSGLGPGSALDDQDKLDSNPAFKRMTRNLKIGKWE